MANSKHTAMLAIPELCRAAGLNVKTLDGWEYNKQGYYWVDAKGSHRSYAGEPNGHMHHHTASPEYTPNVVAKGKTKANMYAGLARPGTDRLYSTGRGTPIVVFASSGPANFGNGPGWKPVITDYVCTDREFPGPLRKLPGSNSDTGNRYAANRWMLGTEIVHRGDGSTLDTGVFELQCQVSAVICQHFGWSYARNIGHEDSTTRKIDPKFAQGAPYTMRAIRTRIRQILNTGTMPQITTMQPEGEYEVFMPLRHTDGYTAGRTDKADDVKIVQALLNRIPQVTDKVKVDGKYGDGTATALRQVLGPKATDNGETVTGDNYETLQAVAYTGADPDAH